MSNEHANILKTAQKTKTPEKKKKNRTPILVASGLTLALTATLGASLLANANRHEAVNTGAAPHQITQAGGLTLTDPSTILDADGPAHVDASKTNQQDKPEGLTTENTTPLQMVIYADPNCSHCAQFEQSYGALLEEKLNNNEITVEYRMTNILDPASPTQYSSRAANALAAVAEKHPSAYLPYLKYIYSQHGTELKNEQLIEEATKLGVDIREEVENKTYYGYVNYTTQTALKQGITGTPSVYINGEAWSDSPSTPTLPEFIAKKADEAAAAQGDKQTEEPTTQQLAVEETPASEPVTEGNSPAPDITNEGAEPNTSEPVEETPVQEPANEETPPEAGTPVEDPDLKQ